MGRRGKRGRKPKEDEFITELIKELGIDEHNKITTEEQTERNPTERQKKKPKNEQVQLELKESEISATWPLFIQNWLRGYAVLLWIGAILCFTLQAMEVCRGEYVEASQSLHTGIVLVGIALVIQILCSYFEDSKSSKITESVETLVPKHVDTDRNREKISIQESQQYDLLREDSELAKVDDRGPADLQKVDASVMVGNSWLSGKSELLARKPEKTSESSKEVVIRIGDSTLLGTIVQLAELSESPDVQASIAARMKWLQGIVFSFGITFMIIGLVLNGDRLHAATILLAFAIGNAPKGWLPSLIKRYPITSASLFVRIIATIAAMKTGQGTSEQIVEMPTVQGKSEQIVEMPKGQGKSEQIAELAFDPDISELISEMTTHQDWTEQILENWPRADQFD